MNSAQHCHDKNSVNDVTFSVGRKLQITLLVFCVVLALSRAIPSQALYSSIMGYLSLVWWAVLIGLLLGGIIDYFVPDGFLFRYLGQRKKSTLIYAAVAGFAMSACSHGILAIAIALYKKGASVPAVVTFLLAAPWANVAMTILMFGLFGWRAALLVCGAIAIALVTGWVYIVLDQKEKIEASYAEVQHDAISWERLRDFRAGHAVKGVAAAALTLANMVLWWILVGVLIAAVIGAYVPQHFFMQYLGPDLSGLSLTLLFATVIEVCSEGSSPIAFEIFNNTGALGNSFVFLMAGVATDYTEIGLIWANIGRRAAIWLPIVTVPQILLLGSALNILR